MVRLAISQVRAYRKAVRGSEAMARLAACRKGTVQEIMAHARACKALSVVDGGGESG